MAAIDSLWQAGYKGMAHATRASQLPAWVRYCRMRMARCIAVCAAVSCCGVTANAYAATLAEDRADALYHAYDGGGVTVDGPSILVRKTIKEKVSVSANYYVDMVSSASIDVLTQGSPYSEERTEYSVGADYLANKAILSLNYTNSSENDYEANTLSFGVSQDFFGDLTTLSLGYAQGDDTVKRNEDGGAVVVGDVTRRRYSIGLTQILTKNWILAFNVETVVDDGFLNNPYRSVRYYNSDGTTVGWQLENYPETRNSDALALRSMYYLPYRAAVRFEARTYNDSWGIDATNFELRYIHPVRENIVLEFKARTYSQSQADFYADVFPYFDENNIEFRARDKELSDYDSINLGIGVTYDLDYKLPFVDRESVSLFWDFISFDYSNFRNALESRSQGGQPPQAAPGEESTYSLEANVIRLLFSAWY